MKKVLILLVAAGILYWIAPVQLQMGIKHTFADVDDYKLFVNHRITRSTHPQSWPLSADYNKYKPSDELLSFFQERKTCAYLVIRNGQLSYEYYGEGYNEKTLSGSFSMAKTVNALLIGKLLEEGKISSLDDDVKKYVPELSHIPPGKLSIRQVMTMSADLDWNESYWNPFSLTSEAYYGNDLDKLMGELYLRKSGLQGKLWDYQSCNTQILGYIIRHASHRSLAENAAQYLWQPLGAENDALWSTDGHGVEKAFCCLNATARDFARLGQMVLQQGRWDSVQVIDSAYIRLMTTPATYLKDELGNTCDWYGLQTWMINYKGHQIPYFRGILGQFIFVIPDMNAVVIRLGEKIKKDPDDPKKQNQDIRNYIEAGLQVLQKNS